MKPRTPYAELSAANRRMLRAEAASAINEALHEGWRAWEMPEIVNSVANSLDVILSPDDLEEILRQRRA